MDIKKVQEFAAQGGYNKELRNKAIKADFFSLLQSGLPTMTAYYRTAKKYGVSDRQVYNIVKG